METMDDFKDELEASFRQIREGDIITGTVIAVSEEEITLDLKYYAQGIIKVEDFSNDPDFAVLEQIHAGDEIEATVVKTDDGQGNILLSRKEANDVLAWEKLQQMMEDGTVVKVRIKESVPSGVLFGDDSLGGSTGNRSHLPKSVNVSALTDRQRSDLDYQHVVFFDVSLQGDFQF